MEGATGVADRLLWLRKNAGDAYEWADIPTLVGAAKGVLPVWNVMDHGATGLGVANDQPAIQRAIDACTAAGGGIVYLPKGTYLVGGHASLATTALSLQSHVWLMGAGANVTTVRLANGADASVVSCKEADTDLGVSDLTIDGNRTQQTLTVSGFRFHASIRGFVRRCVIKECRHYGIAFGYTEPNRDPVTDSVIEDVEIFNCGTAGAGDGIDAKKSLRNTFRNISIHDVEQRGLDVRGQDNTYVNISVRNCGATGLSFRGFGDAPESQLRTGAINCYAINCGSHGFWVDADSELTGLDRGRQSLVNCYAIGNGGRGFYLGGTNVDIRLTNCVAESNGSHGYNLNVDNVTSFRASLVNCLAIDNTLDGFISAANSHGDTVVGCVALNNDGDGFQIDGTAQVLEACSASGNGAAGFNILGASHVFTGCRTEANVGTSFFLNTADDCVVQGGAFQADAADNAIRVNNGADRNTLIGNTLRGAGLGVVIVATAVGTKVLDNNLNGISGTKVSNAGSGTIFRNNTGYVSENKGVTSVADGGTIAHGLATTPTKYGATASVAGEFVSITAVGATTLTVAIKKHDNTAGTTQNVAWWAEL